MRLRRKPRALPQLSDKASPGAEPDPDIAWRILALQGDWIRHAETKSAATLAATGVASGVLYNLVKDQQKPGLPLSLFAVIAGLAAVLAGICAIFALVPRLKLTTTSELGARSLLYFNDISGQYPDDAATYVSDLESLMKDRRGLSLEIGRQAHANAIVASRKFRWANRAVIFVAFSLVALGVLAIIIGSKA